MKNIVNPGAGLGPPFVWGRIHDASKEDNVDLLRDIVEAKNGAPVRDINIPSTGGLTPLHVASMSGSNKCIAYLLSRNAGIDILDAQGRLPVHWAADGGHSESIMHLVSAGQSINSQDVKGNTALHLAARNGKVKAGKYLMLIGADLSLRNDRGWTPLEAATVPMYRTVMEMLEDSLGIINQLRRDHDRQRLQAFLIDCGMERYEEILVSAGYTAHYLLDSCRTVRLSKINERCANSIDKFNQRDYLLLLEAVQSFRGSERCNPFAEAMKRQRYFDEHPEEHQKFLAENPNYEIENADGSEYRRKVLPKEKENMDFMLEILNELRANDKHNIFEDILQKTMSDNENLMFPDIENVVDSGWKDVKVMDFTQIEENIFNGMYTCWEQFQLDCFLMISNVWIYCRAKQSDMQLAFKAAVSLAMRAMRIFRKHNNNFLKKQAAFHEEAKIKRESLRRGWSKIAADKRLRGFLPDRFKEKLLQSEEDGDSKFKTLYTLRFKKLEEAVRHWGYRTKDVYEAARFAWEEDERAKRDHSFLVKMLHLTSSRDIGRHFQHPVDDIRSDMHVPGGENGDSFNVQNFEREIVWPMDFSAMAGRLTEKIGCDHHTLKPSDYICLEQVQLDWLIIVFNSVVYHNKFHVEVKKAFEKQQRRPFVVPRAPCSLRIARDSLKAFSCQILWDQPDSKDDEEIIAYEIEIAANSPQAVDCTRTLCKPGESWTIRMEVPDDPAATNSDGPGANVAGTHSGIFSAATRTYGSLLIEGLCPSTLYYVRAHSIGYGEITSPVSGLVLEVRTPPFVPEPPTNFHVLSASVDNIVFTWDPPRDNGADIIDYEIEYSDLKFNTTFLGRVGWSTNTFSTLSVLREADSSKALDQRLCLPYREDYLLPATSVQARVRARNSEGWGPWNEENFIAVKTLSFYPGKPTGMAIVAEGNGFVDVAWMPPVWSNCDLGVEGYSIDVLFEDENPVRKITECIESIELARELLEGIANKIPQSTSQVFSSHKRPASSKASFQARPKSAEVSFDGLLSRSTPDLERIPHSTEGTQSALKPSVSKDSWWQTSGLAGKTWFCNEVPAWVKHKVSFDFPVVNDDKNVIIVQEEGVFGWEPERLAILPKVYYETIQLANRTQSMLQQTIPFSSPLRWNVFVQEDRFNFVFNCRFRLRMAKSLAYIYGLVLDGDGCVISPPLQNPGSATQKSILVAPNAPQLQTGLSDLIPVDCPFVHRVFLPPARRVSLRVTAKNEMNKVFEDASQLLVSTSDAIQVLTKLRLPEPPSGLEAHGILESAILVTWTKATTEYGSEIMYTELGYTSPDGKEELRLMPYTQEGFSVTSLHPGQTVTNIRVRSINSIGAGHFGSSVSASTKSSSPAPPSGFRFQSSTTKSISFAWTLPAFDGGSQIVQWQVSGFRPNGEVVTQLISGTAVNSCTFADIEESVIGSWLVNVSVKCRNDVGWSKCSNKDDGQCMDCPRLYDGRRQVRTNFKIQQQRLARDFLAEALELGQEAVAQAEDAARRSFRTKKAMMEAAENAVIVAEYNLLDAIQKSEDSGIKELGVMQPPEDMEARMFLQSLQSKRSRRWGASTRGQQV